MTDSPSSGSPLRVLFVIGYLGGGGSERQMLGILNRLDRERFAPHLWLAAAGGELFDEIPADVPVTIFDGDRSPNRIRIPGAAHRHRVRHLAETLDRERIDLIYDRTYHATLLTGAACRQRPTPRLSVVVTDPEQDFETNPERFRAIKRRLLRKSYRTASRVLAVSEGVRQAAVAYHRLSPDQVMTVPNWFDLDRIDRLAAEPLPTDVEWKPDAFHIVAAGRLHPQKGFGDLLEAMRQMRDSSQRIVLHILGTGVLEDTLRQFVRENDLGDRVIFEGYQTNPLPFYRRADLFCLSSHYEGMPNALAEAMLCGTPVLSTDCPSGPSELLENGKLGGLVPVADPTQLAEGIRQAITNWDRSRSFAEDANRSIRHRYGPEAGMERLQQLFESVTGRIR